MSYAIVWEARCFEEIDRLMAAGIAGDLIKDVVRQIARTLAVQPEEEGRALSEGLRRLDVPPFKAYFFVDEAIKRVTVTVLHYQS